MRNDNDNCVTIVFYTTADKSKTYFQVRAVARRHVHGVTEHTAYHRRKFFTAIKNGEKKGVQFGFDISITERAAALLDPVALHIVEENLSKEQARNIEDNTRANLLAAGMVEIYDSPEAAI